MTRTTIYVDQGPTTDGTALASDNLNTSVVAQSYLISGGNVDAGSGGSDLSDIGIHLLMPDTEAVVTAMDMTTATERTHQVYVFVPSTPVPCLFNKDNYVDLSVSEAGATAVGTYTVRDTAFDADPGPPATGALRLCVVRLGSTVGDITVTQLATPCPVSQPMVQADPDEAQGMGDLLTTSTLVDNLNRIRWQLGAIYARVPGTNVPPTAGAWGIVPDVEAWDTSQADALEPMVPWSTRGIPNGVALLDELARIPRDELPASALFFQPSFFSDSNIGAFADPYGALELAVKVSQGLGVDVLYARLANIDQLYATNIGSAPAPVTNLWVTNIYSAQQIGTSVLPVLDLWVTHLHIPPDGDLTLEGPFTAPEVHTPSLWVDDIYQYTPSKTFITVHTSLELIDATHAKIPHLFTNGIEPISGGVINITNGTLNVIGNQINAQTLLLQAGAEIGVDTALAAGSKALHAHGNGQVDGTFLSGIQLTVGTEYGTATPPAGHTGNALGDTAGALIWGPETIKDAPESDATAWSEADDAAEDLADDEVEAGEDEPFTPVIHPASLTIGPYVAGRHYTSASPDLRPSAAYPDATHNDLRVGRSAEIGNNLVAHGAETFGGPVGIGGADPLDTAHGAPDPCDLALQHNLWVRGDATCDGTIFCDVLSVASVVSSSLTVVGDLIGESNGSIAGTLGVGGADPLDYGEGTDLAVQHDAMFLANATVAGVLGTGGTNPVVLSIADARTYDLATADSAHIGGGVKATTFITCGGAMTCGSLDILGRVTSDVLADGKAEITGEVATGAPGSVVGCNSPGGAVRLKRLIYDRGPVLTSYDSLQAGAAVESPNWETNFDNYGAVLYTAPSSGATSGPQFRVQWGGVAGTHGHLPGIFLCIMAQARFAGTGHGSVNYTAPTGSAYVAHVEGPDPTTGGGYFDVGFTFVPVAGAQYCVFYHVIESPDPVTIPDYTCP